MFSDIPGGPLEIRFPTTPWVNSVLHALVAKPPDACMYVCVCSNSWIKRLVLFVLFLRNRSRRLVGNLVFLRPRAKPCSILANELMNMCTKRNTVHPETRGPLQGMEHAESGKLYWL